ncbi:MAG: hypothetical protein GXO88_10220 [Chlorobi bacterium]|nr:hypothetical protein [Chlorobiota bacterium]
MKSTIYLISSVLLMALFSSCNPQKKLAREFVSKSKDYKLLVLAPNSIYKHNLNTGIIDSLGITDEKTRDSLLWEQSYFIKNIDDSLLIANYILGFKNELANYKVKVYNQGAYEGFMQSDSNAWMINIAQLEVEEENYEYRDETEYYGYVYYHDHLLKAVNVNSWFEINKLNSDDQKNNVYYATNTITDDLTSSYDFDIFTEKVVYQYDIDSLDMPGLYEYVYLLGRIYATYTYDYLMNKYISKKQGFPMKKTELLRYYPPSGTFFQAGENRFITLDE